MNLWWPKIYWGIAAWVVGSLLASIGIFTIDTLGSIFTLPTTTDMTFAVGDLWLTLVVPIFVFILFGFYYFGCNPDYKIPLLISIFIALNKPFFDLFNSYYMTNRLDNRYQEQLQTGQIFTAEALTALDKFRQSLVDLRYIVYGWYDLFTGARLNEHIQVHFIVMPFIVFMIFLCLANLSAMSKLSRPENFWKLTKYISILCFLWVYFAKYFSYAMIVQTLIIPLGPIEAIFQQSVFYFMLFVAFYVLISVFLFFVQWVNDYVEFRYAFR